MENYYQKNNIHQGQIRRYSPHRYENLLKKMKKRFEKITSVKGMTGESIQGTY